jgi:hypothetical protein
MFGIGNCVVSYEHLSGFKATTSILEDPATDAFQDQHTNTLERAARRGSSLQRLLRRPVKPVPWSGQTGRRRQIGDEAYEC